MKCRWFDEQNFECSSVAQHGHFSVKFALLALDTIEDGTNIVKDALEGLLESDGIVVLLSEHEGFVKGSKDAAAGLQNGGIQESFEENGSRFIIDDITSANIVIVEKWSGLFECSKQDNVAEMQISNIFGVILESFHEIGRIGFPVDASFSFGRRIIILGNGNGGGGVQSRKKSVENAFLEASGLNGLVVQKGHAR